MSFDACDGPKFAYRRTPHITHENGSHFEKVHRKRVDMAGLASGCHYLYGDVLAHDVTACSV